MIINAPTKVIFQIQEITKVYRMGEVEVKALTSVNLALSEGELVVLFAPSGSGKSTLLNIIGELDVPSSGHVFFRQRDLTHANDRKLLRDILHWRGQIIAIASFVSMLSAYEYSRPQPIDARRWNCFRSLFN